MKEDLARRMYALLCEHFSQQNNWNKLDTETKERWIAKFKTAFAAIGPPPPYPQDPPPPKP